MMTETTKNTKEKTIIIIIFHLLFLYYNLSEHKKYVHIERNDFYKLLVTQSYNNIICFNYCCRWSQTLEMTYPNNHNIDNRIWLLKMLFHGSSQCAFYALLVQHIILNESSFEYLVDLAVVVVFAYIMTHSILRPIYYRHIKNNYNMHYARATLCVTEDELMIFIFTRHNLSYKTNISSEINKRYVTRVWSLYYYIMIWQIVHLRFQSVIRVICTYMRFNTINNVRST